MSYHSAPLFPSVSLIDEELQFISIIIIIIIVCGFIALVVYVVDDEEHVAKVVYCLWMIEIEFSFQFDYAADLVDAYFCRWSLHFLSDVGEKTL
jgi:hypothetical protein